MSQSARLRTTARILGGIRDRLEASVAVTQRKFWTVIKSDIAEKLAGQRLVPSVEELVDESLFRRTFNRKMNPVWNTLILEGVDTEFRMHRGEERQSVLPGDMRVAVQREITMREISTWNFVVDNLKKKMRNAAKAAEKHELSPDDAVAFVMHAVIRFAQLSGSLTARIETTSSMNFGQLIERNELGILNKIWIMRADAHVRRKRFNHSEPNGMIRPNRHPFAISDERMMFPGDLSLGASLENVLGCRCMSIGTHENVN